MIKRILKRLADRAGYVIMRKPAPPTEDECSRFIRIVRTNTMVPEEGLRSLYTQALFCEEQGIPGAYVECGVWKGGAMGLMALINLRYGKERRPLHLFDSFQDICEPDAKVDGARAVEEAQRWSRGGGASGRLVPLTGFYEQFGGAGTVAENRRLLERTVGYDPTRVHCHEGWFQDTLPRDASSIGPVAILRIDADWHASTKICLDHLFDKVVPGGFVIIDDYGAYEGCRKAVDGFLQARGRPLFLNPVNTDIRYIVVP